MQVYFAPGGSDGCLSAFTRVCSALFPTETLSAKYITQNFTDSIRGHLTMQAISYLLSNISKKVTSWSVVPAKFKQMAFN